MIEIKLVGTLASEIYKPDGGMPKRHTPGSAAIDLRACIEEPRHLMSGGHPVQLRTGVSIHIGDPSKVGKIYARSSLSTKSGIVLANTIGVIDSDYQGEILVTLRNISTSGIGRYTVTPGDRIAQLAIEYVSNDGFLLVDEFSSTTRRGEGGHGSTGRN